MLDDLEAADGWTELTYEEQTERIRTAFDAQLERDKAEDPRKALATAGKKCWNVLCKHGDCKTQSRGREDAIGIIRVVDKHGKLVCPLHRCGKHGGRSNGRTKRDELLPSERCTHPGCRAGNHGGTSQIKTPIGGKPNWWRYCTVPHKDADAPRRQLFAAIRDKLGQNDPDVQAKLTKLNTKQLILTSQRRLFYVDAAHFVVQELALRAEEVSDKTGVLLQIYKNGQASKVQCVLHTPKQWASAVEGALTQNDSDLNPFRRKSFSGDI